MKNELYPLKFQPILKDKVWGGSKLKTVLHKNTTSNKTGESWEISAIENSVSVVDNGTLKGKSLTDLLSIYKADLVGEEVYHKYGNKFPLLFKFLDAGQNLSLQLHPNNEIAKKRHNSFGKTEMWYVLQVDNQAGIYVGFEKGTTREDYLRHLENGSLEKIMNFEEVKPGDVFYIKPGLVHSIGEGVLLAEIQQSSDITYRIFDWNRRDLNGEPRTLHTELALDVIDFEFEDFKIEYENEVDVFQTLVKSDFFKTRRIDLSKDIEIDYSATSSFVVFMCVKGKADIQNTEFSVSLKYGETLLIPACINQIKIKTKEVELLEVSL
ncbi:MAG TPA: type I phosphomannose isomerase catalytic subunit [Flavobacteriaceae bacterium]|nr:type I phosphomannose isomerase catalytic subunit [Flavobacteriaceae bacterium]